MNNSLVIPWILLATGQTDSVWRFFLKNGKTWNWDNYVIELYIYYPYETTNFSADLVIWILNDDLDTKAISNLWQWNQLITVVAEWYQVYNVWQAKLVCQSIVIFPGRNFENNSIKCDHLTTILQLWKFEINFMFKNEESREMFHRIKNVCSGSRFYD